MGSLITRRTFVKGLAGSIGIAAGQGLLPGHIFGKELTPVKASRASGSLSFGVFFVGKDGGLYEKQGIEMNDTMIRGSGATQALIGGSVDFLYSASPEPIIAISKGMPITLISQEFARMNMAIVTSKKRAEKFGISFKGTPPKKKAEILKGGTWGYTRPGSMTAQLLRWAAKWVGLDPDRDMKLIPVGSAQAMIASLKKGVIDGYAHGIPWPLVPVFEGFGELLLSPPHGEIEPLQPLTYTVLATRADVIRDRPEVVKAVARGSQAAVRLINEDPGRAKQILRKKYGKLSPGLFDSSIELVFKAVAKSAHFDEAGLRNAIGLLEAAGTIPKGKVQPKDVYTNKFLA